MLTEQDQTGLTQTANPDSYLTLEVFLIGGLSIITSLIFLAFFEKSMPLFAIGNFVAAAAFVANHPHFMSSYILMYGDFSKKIFKFKRYFWSGVVVPLILIALLSYSLIKLDKILLGHIVASMFFLVGWHYVKQIFGFIIVTSAHRKIYYSQLERKVLLTNLLSIWMLSFLGSQVGTFSYSFYEIPYQSYNLPKWTLQLDHFVLVVSLLALIILQIKKYIDLGIKPPPPAVAAFVAIYVWHLPTISHPGFSYIIPFFHSIQYLSFVWILKKNQTKDRIKTLVGPAYRRAWLKYFGGFFLLSLLTGALFFEFIPKYLDQLELIPKTFAGASPILAVFLLFINIHHYFIDNTIWRSENETVKKYLF